MPLVPPALLVPLWFAALALPNLVYSGVSFYDTLHIMKWTVTGVPIAVALLVAGARLALYGRDRIRLEVDLFGVHSCSTASRSPYGSASPPSRRLCTS